MVLYLKLDTHKWAEADFTDVDALRIGGTIYSNVDMTTPLNLTGYTLKLRVLDKKGALWTEKDAVINTAADGTWYYEPSATSDLDLQGTYLIRIQLTKTGTQLTAIGINGSDEIYFPYS